MQEKNDAMEKGRQDGQKGYFEERQVNDQLGRLTQLTFGIP
jgi:hypothetical protein